MLRYGEIVSPSTVFEVNFHLFLCSFKSLFINVQVLTEINDKLFEIKLQKDKNDSIMTANFRETVLLFNFLTPLHFST